MSQERIEIGKHPFITVSECHGDLNIRGGADTAVLIKGDEYKTSEIDEGLSVICQGDLSLIVPTDSDLSVNEVHGDLSIKNVQGNLSLKNMAGDVSLLHVGTTKIGVIHSDFAAKNVAGNLSAETINGDAIIRQCDDLALGTVHGDLSARMIEGTAEIVEVMGDLSLRHISGDIAIKQGHRDANLRGLAGEANTLANIAGDIRLHGPLPAGKHTFVAGGDIVLRWPESAGLSLTAVAPQIKNRIRLEDIVEDGNMLSGRMGDGSAVVSLQANGRIALKEAKLFKEKWPSGDDLNFDFDFDFDFEGIGDLINNRVFEQVNRMTSDLETKFGPEFHEKLERDAERAVAKAERAAEKAIRRAEKSMKRGWRHQAPSPPRPPKPPTPPTQKASSEEQLKILKMVEKGKISPDEAGTLLEALEN